MTTAYIQYAERHLPWPSLACDAWPAEGSEGDLNANDNLHSMTKRKMTAKEKNT